MTWNNITTKPEDDRIVLIYDGLHGQIGLGWRDKSNAWMWPMVDNVAIRITDTENQVSHWMYSPSPTSEIWNSTNEKPPEPGRPVLLHHPKWSKEFSIGMVMLDGRWQLTTATFGRNDLAPFVDDGGRMRYWMPRPDPPNI